MIINRYHFFFIRVSIFVTVFIPLHFLRLLRVLQRLKQCRDVQIFVESHSSRLMFPFKLWPPVFLTSSFLKARKEV